MNVLTSIQPPTTLPQRSATSRFQSTPGVEPAPDRVQWSQTSEAPPPTPAPTPERTGPSARLWATLGLGVLGVAGTLAGGLGPALAHGSQVEQVQAQPQPAATRAATHKADPDEYHPLAYEQAHFGQVPSAHSFGKAPVKMLDTHGSENKGNLQMSWSTQTLTDSQGVPLWTPSGQGEVIAAFKQDGTSNWNHHFHLSPAGHVGPYLSMVVSENGYTGGMGEQKESHLVTVRADTGSEVTLDQIVEPTDFEDIVSKIQEVQSYVPGGQAYQVSPQEVREAANHSFSLFKEGGKFKVAVAIPANQQSEAGTVAEYVFQLPSEAWAH